MSEVTCRITFMDGKRMNFAWERRGEDEGLTGGALMEKVLNNQTLAFEVDGRMLLLPVQNIRTIEISPAPDRMPPIVLHGATLTD